ncbi:hypothetical protein CUMW_005020 [Citrus unshiu]|nr:hypothetical protein CUMW_005020 [Citrus unshiu]
MASPPSPPPSLGRRNSISTTVPLPTKLSLPAKSSNYSYDDRFRIIIRAHILKITLLVLHFPQGPSPFVRLQLAHRHRFCCQLRLRNLHPQPSS